MWIKKGHETYQIISVNLHEKDGKHSVWAERPRGNTMKLGESTSKQEVEIIKNAIEYAIENNVKVLEL